MFQAILESIKSLDPFMIMILLTSFLGVAIILDRVRVLVSAANIRKEEILNHINSYILQGSLDKAIAVTSQTRNPLTSVIRAGLVAVSNNGGAEEVQTAMDAVALREVPLVEKRIGLLATLSNIATLLGLLGTVAGLIGAFSAVANVAPAEKATMLAGSISQAMNTTAFGLMVAIPLLGAFGYLSTMAQSIVDDMHEATVATLNFVMTNREKLKK